MASGLLLLSAVDGSCDANAVHCEVSSSSRLAFKPYDSRRFVVKVAILFVGQELGAEALKP